MNEQKMREAFEQWVVSDGVRRGYGPKSADRLTERNYSGGYSTVWVHGAWYGWQAALAAPAPSQEPKP